VLKLAPITPNIYGIAKKAQNLVKSIVCLDLPHKKEVINPKVNVQGKIAITKPEKYTPINIPSSTPRIQKSLRNLSLLVTLSIKINT